MSASTGARTGNRVFLLMNLLMPAPRVITLKARHEKRFVVSVMYSVIEGIRICLVHRYLIAGPSVWLALA